MVCHGITSIWLPLNSPTVPLFSRATHILCSEPLETVPLNPETVNQTSERIGPECFDLLKVLGKGGYGKVLTHVCVVVGGGVFLLSSCSLGVSGQKNNRYRQRKDLCNESFEEGMFSE